MTILAAFHLLREQFDVTNLDMSGKHQYHFKNRGSTHTSMVVNMVDEMVAHDAIEHQATDAHDLVDIANSLAESHPLTSRKLLKIAKRLEP